MEKNKCPVCGEILDLQEVDGGKQFICACGDSSDIYPVVQGEVVRIKREWRVKINCPFCGKVHYHGETEENPLPALRKSHCSDPTKTGKALEELLEEYPLAYEGGTYYVFIE